MSRLEPLGLTWPPPHGCNVALASPATTRREGSIPAACISSFGLLQQAQNLPQKIPFTSHPPEMCQVASPSSNKGGRLHLDFNPPPRRKPEKKGIESVIWVSQPTVSGSTGEEK